MNKLIHHQIYIAINYAIISLLLCYCYVIITGYHTELAANNINLTSYFTAILGTLGIIHLSIFVEHKLPLIKTILNWIGQNSICFIGLNIVIIDYLDYYLRPNITNFIIYKSLQFLITISICALISALANRYFPPLVGKSK